MNTKELKNELLSLEEKLKESSRNNPHTARHLYFELQRLVHQYASSQIRAESTKLS